ncbi:MAG: flavin reductase [Tractidigestivibacter sp.]
MFSFSYGLYVVSATDGENVGACLINTAIQVTGDPLQVAITVNKQNHTTEVIKSAEHFTLTVVSKKADMPYIGRFGFRSSADFDKFDGIETKTSSLFDPYTPVNTCSVITAAVVNTIDLGTHLMFIGEVTDAERTSDDEPMTYAYYHSVLKGKTPPKASSYIEGADPSETPKPGAKHHFRCAICGYIYETDEEELPEDFRCPLCGVGRDNFVKVD